MGRGGGTERRITFSATVFSYGVWTTGYTHAKMELELDVLVHTCNPYTRKADARRSQA
jgi:hypothetical protein